MLLAASIHRLSPVSPPPQPDNAPLDFMHAGHGMVNLVRGLSFVQLGTATRAAGQLVTLLLPALTVAPSAPGVLSRGVDANVTHGGAVQYCISTTIPPGQCASAATGGCLPFSVTLVWTDPPGSPASLYALVNNLDLEVVTPDGRLLRGNNDEADVPVSISTALASRITPDPPTNPHSKPTHPAATP